ncbi:peptidoglycan DD-metalloendopeptidase family protein [Streptomyces sp. NPDC048644]|uniref:peptidoglycan DD-metalloendopeptidase family protein n=1 Tax=Streptomyces sp. NPDC048644 TaxID=3365582 RepID=UPI00371FA766
MTPTTLRKLLQHTARACLFAFLAVVIAGFFATVPYWVGWIPLGLWMLCVFGGHRLAVRAGTEAAAAPERAAVAVGVPVTGRWTALNSPADKVPSHGTRAYGQTYAIDIVAEPEPGARPAFGWWPPARRNADFPAFGAPLLAVADATVVRADARRRDHLSRTSWPALVYLFVVEGVFRTLGGAGAVVGNHVVLDLGDGTYALYAHVRRGSLTVRAGDRVRSGQPLGQCGNSGNSTEPHVHFQLMSTADPDTADGIPFTWHGIGVPHNGETFDAAPAGIPGR